METQNSIEWYKEFLATAPQDDPKVAHMSHLLADAYVATQEYSLAVLHYEAAAYAHEGYEKSAEAGYASLVAYQEYKNQFENVWIKQNVLIGNIVIGTVPADVGICGNSYAVKRFASKHGIVVNRI